MVLGGVCALWRVAKTRPRITANTTTPATPQAATGIRPPSGGLVENIAGCGLLPGGTGACREESDELTALSSGRFCSFISRDFIPQHAMDDGNRALSYRLSNVPKMEPMGVQQKTRQIFIYASKHFGAFSR